MDAVRKNLLEETYERIINVGLCIVPYEDLSDFAAPELMFFGTTKDQKVFSFSELEALFKSQYEQMAGFVNSLNRKRLFTRTSNDGKNAFITEEVTLTLTSPEEVNTIFMRCSCVMEYIDNHWKLTHLHASTPVDTENDHWHMEEWKREKEKLQKLVDQQTADLKGKNRKLKIEAALERIRAQVTSMKESSDLLDIVVTMRTEFVKLGHEAHYFWHMRWLPEKYEKAMTSGDGTRIGMVMTLPRHIHGDIQPVAAWEKSDEPTYVLAMDVDKAVDYVDKMISLGDFERVDPQAPSLDDIRHIGGLTFIMARTTHGEIGFSLPGMVPDPPKDAVDTLVRFAGVFDLAYKRFEDLKAAERQHREAQIELALERVRARTMAMQSSDEFADVAAVLFDQVRTLGGDLWGTGFGLCEEDAENEEFWFANENGVFPAVSIPNTEDPAHKQMYEGWKSKIEFLALEASGENLKKHYNYMMTLPEVRPFFQKILDEGLTFPEWQQWNAAYFSHGYLLIITLEPYSNQEILKRFALVFDQTYTRFLDLKKAEAQARESEIQLALERVRARSMAMHQSDELADLSLELVKQVQALGIDTWFCAFNIYDDHPEGSIEWGSNGQGTFPRYRTPREGVFLDYYEAGQRGETLLINEIGEDECPAHYDYLCSLPGVGNQLLRMKDEGIPFPNSQIDHVTFFKYGYIIFITFEPVPEAHDIFIRFARVFQQTYTRFLDLQKSEEQAREAKIEAALERVRARSMGMHKSDDLIDVVREIGKGIHELGIQLHYSQIYTDYSHDPKTGLNIWVDVEGQDYLEKFHLPYIDHSITLNYYNALNEGLDYFSDRYSKAEKDSFFKLLFKYSDLRRIPKKRKELILNASGWTRFTVILNEATLNFGRYSLDEFTDQEHEIFIRFAKVFGQAYTRFLDLQKAEEQAKEAQVETALEKIRSRTMGMQSSDELPEVANLLFLEIQSLGIPAWSCGYNILEEDKKTADAWMSSEGTLQDPFKLRLYGEASFDEMGSFTQSDKIMLVQELGGEALEEHYKHMKSFPDLKSTFAKIEENGLSLPTYQINHLCKFSHGFLLFITYEPVPEAHNIFKRFTKVFDQTYTRFLDLQKAEEQAKEAKIELSLERIRSQVTTMRESSDLFDIVVSMRSEFISLGHDADYFWHMRWLPDVYEMSMTSEDGHRLGMIIKVPKFVHDQIPDLAEWEKGSDPTYVLALDVDEAWDYIENMNEHGDYEVVDPNAPSRENIEHIGGLTFIIARTTHGEIGYSLPGVVPKPPKDALDTLVSFAGVFDLAYTRFEDLKAAEHQALLIRKERDHLEIALKELHATQDQLIQQEKLASLGQLTAGIAHEIKNPLNFVNNFSEVSVELIEEVREQLLSEKAKVKGETSTDEGETKNSPLEGGAVANAKAGDVSHIDEALEILNDIEANLRKIHEHGTRADSIVKSMLEHSRGGSGKMEPTDLNALVKEFVNLTFHGMRASKNPINVDMEFELDESIGEVPLIAEDFSRVIINLCNNAFDAMREKLTSKDQASSSKVYIPKLFIRTYKKNQATFVEITDNGAGISDDIKDKILQPFFTTKKGTEGTGLGLSITNDIIKAHGGFLDVSTKPDEGTCFTIKLS